MATATAIYALTKPATSDPALIGDINTNMDTLDRQITHFGYKGADIASAATLTLPTTGSVFDVTGTTTITALSTRPAGECVILQFDGAVLVTHNASTLKLLTGANYTTAAGDILGFVSDGGGNWRQYLHNSLAAITGFTGFDATVPTSDTFGTAATVAAAGSATTAAHRDHVHGFPAAFDATIPAEASSGASTAGAAAVAARRDHTHGHAHTSGTATVLTGETTSSTSYTDLTTPGPAVTLTPGVTRAHLILFEAGARNSVASTQALFSVAIAGAAASDNDAANVAQQETGHIITMPGMVLAPAQASGVTHTMKYRVVGGTGTYSNRRIIGVAL